MPQTKKVFPLRLDEEAHTEIKKGAENKNKSMHQFILDAALNETKKDDTYNLIEWAYRFVKNGPAPKLEDALFNWLMENK